MSQTINEWKIFLKTYAHVNSVIDGQPSLLRTPNSNEQHDPFFVVLKSQKLMSCSAWSRIVIFHLPLVNAATNDDGGTC